MIAFSIERKVPDWQQMAATVKEEYGRSGDPRYVWLIGLTAALGGFLFGYDTGVIGGAMPALEKYFQMDATQLGLSVASVFAGAILGAMGGGWLSDLMGRRRVLMLTGVAFLLSGLLTGIAQTVTQFDIGRFIGGIGIGVALPIVGVYLAEISPARYRGRVVTLNQLVITFGILISYVVGFVATNMGEELWQVNNSWRWMFGSEVIPSAIFLLALQFIPESPRWLIQQGRIEEAESIIARVEGTTDAKEFVEEIKQVINAEDISVRQLFRPGLRTALSIGIMLVIFDQITGINIVIYYIQKILLQLGLTPEQAWQGTLAVGLVNFLTTILALAVVDRIGRKPLLTYCPLIMGVCMFFIGLQFFTEIFPPLSVLAFILVYLFFYALGPGPVVLLLLSEIFPTHLRGKAVGISTLFLWVSTYLVSEQFPSWLVWSESGTFWILAGTCFLYALYSWRVIPETKGMTLEQIEQQWSSEQTSEPLPRE
ncbi:MAG: sugar porter family MFS transporter [Pseudomonadota bacterium]|nr:sugar porter family MFS transporter [Pseudomonadota bacterium]